MSLTLTIMVIGLLGAFAAALCYGVGAVFQALAARQTASAEGLDPRLLLRLARSWRFLLGIGMDGLGFLLSIAALRSLPLFAVQSIVAGFLAVTAVLGAIFLHMPLRLLDRIGVGVVILGLTMVGLSAAEEHAGAGSQAQHWGLLVATGLLALLALPLARIRGPRGAAALGADAGLAFGAVAVASRMITAPLTVHGVITDPASYALVVAAVVGQLSYSTALQRGSVTQATASLVVLETVAPAIVGVVMLGDHPRHGWTAVAIIGFVLAVAGAITLSRHGEVSEPELEGDSVKSRAPRRA